MKAGVENLWTNGENPVERATTKYIFAQIACESARHAKSRRLRALFRLIEIHKSVESALLLIPTFQNLSNIVRHRFERIIAGRCYLIEVARVEEKRWRAQLQRVPGVPAAMMPFYGETPDEAATHLADWLDRAHQLQARQANKTPSGAPAV
jgi:hypothetical protein